MIVPANPLVMKDWTDDEAITAWIKLGFTREEAKAHWNVFRYGNAGLLDGENPASA